MRLMLELDKSSLDLLEDQLRATILAVIDNTVDEGLNARRYLKKAEASNYSHVSISTFNKWLDDGLPSHLMNGSGVTLFDRLEIDDWIHSNGVPSG